MEIGSSWCSSNADTHTGTRMCRKHVLFVYFFASLVCFWNGRRNWGEKVGLFFWCIFFKVKNIGCISFQTSYCIELWIYVIFFIKAKFLVQVKEVSQNEVKLLSKAIFQLCYNILSPMINNCFTEEVDIMFRSEPNLVDEILLLKIFLFWTNL